MLRRTKRTITTGKIQGRVMYRNRCQEVAPSSCAASCSSIGMVCSRASTNKAQYGRYFQSDMMTIDTITHPGLNQGIG
jgi:hypothetical protein